MERSFSTEIMPGRLHRQVIDVDGKIPHRSLNDRFDEGPFAAREPTSDSWHVDASALGPNTDRDLSKAFKQSAVLEGHAGHVTVLRNHVDDANILGDRHILHGPECKCPCLWVRLSPMPSSVSTFRLWPSFGEPKNETFSPTAPVVAHVDDEFVAFARGARSVTFVIGNHFNTPTVHRSRRPLVTGLTSCRMMSGRKTTASHSSSSMRSPSKNNSPPSAACSRSTLMR